jgi:hypothetical protein
MGGWGSGRYRDSRKLTVEECLSLCIDQLIKAGLLKHQCGNIRCGEFESGETYGFQYLLKPSDAPEYLYLYLFFTAWYGDRTQDLWEPITLEARPQQWGGVRYSFRCRDCIRRVRKVYMPPGRTNFACRACHNLTYRSVQEHDKWIDFFRRNPEVLDAAVRAGSRPAMRCLFKTLLRWHPENVVTITGHTPS